MDRYELLHDLFLRRGDSEYGGEAVTQLEHALQSATLAEQAAAAPSLIVAALLHDIGHLLHDLAEDAPDRGVDDHHEDRGSRFLERHFSTEVTAPVRLHVAAKRYLCTVDPSYLARLSQPSLVSLQLQGGLMNQQELEAFRGHPQWQDALSLRRWDDIAKVPGLKTPDVEHFLAYLESLPPATD